MFTGIITNTGVVAEVKKTYFTIESDLKKIPSIGGSIAIDGACFTILSKSKKKFKVQAMEETLDRSISATYKKGSVVNLELPLTLNSPLDGHIVTGHVDFTASLKKMVAKKNSVSIHIACTHKHLKYVAIKGSIAVNGISLTITGKTNKSFSVDLLPYTLKETNLNRIKPGSKVNIETDLIAKYISSLS